VSDPSSDTRPQPEPQRGFSFVLDRAVSCGPAQQSDQARGGAPPPLSSSASHPPPAPCLGADHRRWPRVGAMTV